MALPVYRTWTVDKHGFLKANKIWFVNTYTTFSNLRSELYSRMEIVTQETLKVAYFIIIESVAYC